MKRSEAREVKEASAPPAKAEGKEGEGEGGEAAAEGCEAKVLTEEELKAKAEVSL